MWGTIIAAAAGAVIGGAVQGVVAAETSKQKVNAYKQAATDVRNAANKYSGKNEYEKQMQAGLDDATNIGNLAAGELVADVHSPTNPGSTGVGANASASQVAANNASMTNAAAQSGANFGISQQAARDAALYNANTVGAQQAMKQSDIDYNVANQTAQEAMNTASNIANTYNQLRTKNGRQIAE